MQTIERRSDSYLQLRRAMAELAKMAYPIVAVEASLVKLCLDVSGRPAPRNLLLRSFVGRASPVVLSRIAGLLATHKILLDLETLSLIFEALIPAEERKVNGAVFTPKQVKNLIINEISRLQIGKLDGARVCDPACGCGSFLLSAVQFLRKETGKSFRHLFRKNIFGVDILPHNIERARLLLTLAAVLSGEDAELFEFNLHAADSLRLNWQKLYPDVFASGGFDVVVGNPPYVRAKNIPPRSRESLRRWTVAQTGNPDLYIPFFQLAAEIVRPNGVVGYISVNSYLHSLNGRALRGYFSKNRFFLRVINFEDSQIFGGVTSYTCVTVIRKSPSKHIEYAEYRQGRAASYASIAYDELDDHHGWRLASPGILEKLKKLESSAIRLGERYSIRNGIATLRNDIYVFSPARGSSRCFRMDFGAETYSIEKEICRDIVKPNILRTETDLVSCRQKLLFPYFWDGRRYQVIPEKELAKKYPGAYQYFKAVRPLLARRDKGKKKYPVWYAFGRSQGLNVTGKKIFLPYMAAQPVAVICEQSNMMFYCGYAIEGCQELDELKILKKILTSDVFWYYMKHTSKHYSNGYMSFAKNYIARFPLPILSAEDKMALLETKTAAEANDVVCRLYQNPFGMSNSMHGRSAPASVPLLAAAKNS